MCIWRAVRGRNLFNIRMDIYVSEVIKSNNAERKPFNVNHDVEIKIVQKAFSATIIKSEQLCRAI